MRDCTHRVCRWCYADEKQIRTDARRQGVKPNLSGPPDIAAVRFHERRAAAHAAATRIEVTELPTVDVPRRNRKSRAAAPATTGVAIG